MRTQVKNFQTKKWFFILLLINALLHSIVLHAQNAHSINGNVFLKDQHVQVGIAPCGSFGTNATVPVGQGYHPRSNHLNQLGFVADPAQDGWTVGMPDFIGDYFLPEIPEEGWGLTIGGQNFNNNLICSVNEISGSITNYTSSPTASATWTGTVSQLKVVAVTYIPNGKSYFVTKVTLTNLSSNPISDIYYMRNVDPDHGVETPSQYSNPFSKFITTNTIVYQNPNTCNKALVSAETWGDKYYLGLGSIDPRARVNHGGFSNRSAFNLWNYNAVGSNTADAAISIAFNIGTLGANETTSFAYVYILDEQQLEEALLETAGTINVDGLPYLSGSTAGTCPGMIPLEIGDPGGYSWSWSPASGLNTSVGPSVIANISSPITYTATGTSSCGNLTLNISLSPTATPPPTTANQVLFYCQNQPAVPLTATGTNLQWYTVATGGSPSNTAPTPSTDVPGIFYYYVSQKIGACNESDRTTIIVKVKPIPGKPIVEPLNICHLSTSKPLTAQGVNLLWYTSPSGGTPLSTAPSPNTSNLGVVKYYVSQTVEDCESERAELVLTVVPCGTITGQINVCQNSLMNYTLLDDLPSGTVYEWNIINGTINSTTDNTVNVVWGNILGLGTISVTAKSPDGSIILISSLEVQIQPIPKPFITINNLTGCLNYNTNTDPDLGVLEQMFNDGTVCIQTCSNSISTFSVHGVSGSSYEWSVTGGTIISIVGDKCTVQWGGPGFASITVQETMEIGCIGTKTSCIELVESPLAGFEIDSYLEETNCINQEVLFFDKSTASTNSPIVSWHWDFGDGTTFSSAHSTNPTHSYQNSGTYLVTLTVKNHCNCLSTYTKYINVNDFPTYKIECVSIACEGQQATYFIKDEPCPEYKWKVEGGHIISHNEREVTVIWDDVKDDGFGLVKYYSLCGECESISTVKIPVIKQTGKIIGAEVQCKGENYLYQLPAWPGTVFNWSVNSTIAELNKTDQPNEISLKASDVGTVILKCEYYNSLTECGGSAFIELKISDKPVVKGENSACINASLQYDLITPVSGTYKWKMQSPDGTTLLSAPNISSFYTGVLNLPGSYIISIVTSDFCPPDPIFLKVQNTPPAPASISGATNFCNNVPYEYAVNPLAGTLVEWSSPTLGTDVIFVGSNVGNKVTVKYIGTSSSFILQARRKNNNSPHCYSDSYSITVNKDDVSAPISGNGTPCPSTNYPYNISYTNGELYTWEVIPAIAGSIATGNGTNSVTVTWNNAPLTCTLRVKIRKCGTDYIVDKPIVIGSNQIVNLSAPSTICRGQNLWISHDGYGTNQIQWDFGNGVSQTTSNTNGVSYQYVSKPLSIYPSDENYIIKATISGPQYCTPVNASFAITVKPSPMAYITPVSDYDNCNLPFNHSLTANEQPGFLSITNYKWFHNGVQQSSCSSCTSFNANSYGQYWFEAESANGCSVRSEKVNVKCETPPLNCSFTSPPVISLTAATDCDYVSVTASTSSVPQSYFWSHNGSLLSQSISNLELTLNTAGNHSVSYLTNYLDDNSQLCPLSKSINVFVEAAPALDLQILCSGNGYNIELLDNSSFAGGVSVLGYDFFVDDGSGEQQLSPSGNIFPSIVNMFQGGNYTFRLVVHYSYNGGSTKTCEAIKTINLQPIPTVDFTFRDNTCAKAAIYFDNLSTNFTSAFWDFNDNSQNTMSSVYKAFELTGKYDIKLTVSNNTGCNLSLIKQVNVKNNNLSGNLASSPAANPGVTVCPQDAIALSFISTGLENPSTFTWYSHNELLGVGTLPGFTPSKTGYYWVKYSDGDNCWDVTNAIAVTVVNLPDPVIEGDNTVCENGTVKLSAFAGNGLHYQWHKDGVMVGTNHFELVEDAPLIPGTYNYTVTVTDGTSSCKKESEAFMVTVMGLPPEPQIQMQVNDCSNFSVLLEADSGTPGIYNWSNGLSGYQIEVNNGGPYKVWFTDGVTGCSSSSELWVPKPVNHYLWAVPSGCYTKCLKPSIEVSGPIIPFHHWIWLLNNNHVADGNQSVPAPLIVDHEGVYNLEINDNFCYSKSEDLIISRADGENCDNSYCHDFPIEVFGWEDYEDCGLRFGVVFQHSGGLVTYTISSSLGGIITPASGIISNPTVEYFTWLPQSGGPYGYIEFTIRFWRPDGTWCEQVFSYEAVCKSGRYVINSKNNEIQKNTQVTLYPNPTTGNATLGYQGFDFGLNSFLEIYDVNGKKVLHQPVYKQSGSITIACAAWPAGIYFVRLSNKEGQSATIKLIVTK